MGFNSGFKGLMLSEHNYVLSHRLVHTTICFSPVYWPSSGCVINLISSYTICAWGTLGGRDLDSCSGKEVQEEDHVQDGEARLRRIGK